jgi:epoxyqueuosine reductase
MGKVRGEDVAAAAEQHGLVYLGRVALSEEPEFPRFAQWLAEGKHADMAFLAENQALRRDPRGLLAGARSAIVLGWPYRDHDSLKLEPKAPPRIAMYARFRDYHKTLRQKGEAILQHLQQKDSTLVGRVTVDSAPVLERALAKRTAQGFVGKNTLYIHPTWGSYLLLMEILLDQDLGADIPSHIDHAVRSPEGGCGTCRRCEVHCPTGALNGYTLDARKCLAYYTIEHRGTIPLPYWPFLRLYIFGCDLCQLACPYNKHAPQQTAERRTWNLDLATLAMMSQADYEAWFGGTPVTRAKRSGLRRNALIAMVVMNDPRVAEVVQQIRLENEPLLHATCDQIPDFFK